jgi:transposase
VCLGRYDEVTGEIIPSKKKQTAVVPHSSTETVVNVRVCGPNILLSHIDEELGLGKLVKSCFPTISEQIMSMVYFIVQKGLPLSRIRFWSFSHVHPFGEIITSQCVSEILKKMDESSRQNFLSRWANVMAENDYLCYDITSVSSYAKSNEFVMNGYNRDKETLPQINLAVLFGQKCNLPAYYRRLPGSISDVSTLKTTINTLKYLEIELSHTQMVMDRGFYSLTNIDELFENRIHFIIGVPVVRKWVQEIIDQYYEQVTRLENYYITDDDEALFAVTHLHSWGEKRRRCYVHLYYNAEHAADDYDKLTRTLIECKREIEEDKQMAAHQELYDQFFVITQTPKRGKKVEYNNEEIQKFRNRYCGFFCILSSKMKDAHEAIDVYRAKDVVENNFDDLKNSLDMKRLRVHSAQAMDARLFIQFLATIFVCKIRNTIRSQTDPIIKHLSFREVMESMEPLALLTNEHKYKAVLSELTRVQQKLVAAFGLTLS